MSIFVLVHGAWHSGWAWEKVAPLLEAAGHRVETPDLPGYTMGGPVPTEITLGAYADRVAELLDSLSEPAILVGHSMGGTVISEAAERRPDGVKVLIYLCAFLLADGVSLAQISQQDSHSLVTQNLKIDEERGVVTIPEGVVRDAFYGECPADLATWAQARLVPQPIAPFLEPLSLSEANFGRVPRVYVECLRDRAITPALQREMYTQVRCQEVMSIDTDHSPFLSRPAELARYLLSLAKA
ncbi:alpha/beta fold hydrolase [Deinococcus sp. HMF7620]|uniref:Alpha/beta fold hydrolase n=1 Tax=Deinococcus arboris TaxID=2682977 RepID=A0A7C9MAB7_9DEIO|nr:alpha/beta fold hydrolase [Deinococcus arboris]MVN88239.1 alpha/beta fold hydrolase [Deinococcus arboris]